MSGYLIDFIQVDEEDGSLVFFEENMEIPFSVKRIFYIFNVPNCESRANHASMNTDFVLIAIQGNISVTLDDGVSKTKFVLTKKNQGLFVPKLHWMITDDFTEDAVLLVIASESYKKTNYISDYKDFLDSIK